MVVGMVVSEKVPLWEANVVHAPHSFEQLHNNLERQFRGDRERHLIRIVRKK